MKTITTLTKIAAAILCVCLFTNSNAQVAADNSMLTENSIASNKGGDSKNATGNEKAVAAKNEVEKSSKVNITKPITFSAFPDNKNTGLIYLYSNSTCGLIEITDMEGTLVHTQAYENETQNLEPTYIDAPLIPGTYTISFRCENQVVAKQLVIK